MDIMFVASEVAPYSKTGGLADVCSALPKALDHLGHNVILVTPLYKCVREYFQRMAQPLEQLYGVTLEAPVGKLTKRAGVCRATLPESNVTIYFIEHDDYFNRDGLYNQGQVDYQDNCARYSFFCRCALELIRRLSLHVDIIHANDWQTGLIPVFLDTIYKSEEASRFYEQSQVSWGERFRPRIDRMIDEYGKSLYDHIKTVITIHNLRHQGKFCRDAMDLVGLDWSLFTFDKLEFYGQLNLLKAGLVFSDLITTVSPRYAEEIQTVEFGERLQGVLQCRASDLVGILNGVDIDEWNPATDPTLAANYDVDSFKVGKAICKASLQKKVGLPQDPETPLFGVVSRFDAQKGLDLVAQCAPTLIEKERAQFVVLGSGDRTLTKRFLELAQRYPNNFATRTEFSVELSHQIEAGIDIFLMPSRYEPCGLNQFYSLRYGSLPVVRDVGGLHDSVVNASDENINAGVANGFLFYWSQAEDMLSAINWALHCYRHRHNDWDNMIRTAMSTDLSWNRSAKRYAELYQDLIKTR
ncbi:MAG: glycogen/starch synthase [Planctomycetia bacterium]|nr:glycogen/starch synthase [Planctomycetia bacterium]